MCPNARTSGSTVTRNGRCVCTSAQARGEAERAACGALRLRMLLNATLAWKRVQQNVRLGLSTCHPSWLHPCLTRAAHLDPLYLQVVPVWKRRRPSNAHLPKQGQQAEAAAREAVARRQTAQALAAFAAWRAAVRQRRDACAAGRRMAESRAALLLRGVFVEWRALLQVDLSATSIAFRRSCCL